MPNNESHLMLHPLQEAREPPPASKAVSDTSNHGSAVNQEEAEEPSLCFRLLLSLIDKTSILSDV